MSWDTARDDFEAGLKPLWARAQAGDEAAYRESLRRIAARLRSYLRRRMQSLPDELEDLVQETLLALHLQRGTHDPALPVSHWVLAIARHKLVDLWRRRGRQEALHDPLDELDDSAMPVSHWVLAIARHKLVDLWRRRGRQEALHDPLDELDDSAMPAAADEGSARRDLVKLLDALPAAQRQAIVLTKIEGLSVAEAALRTGASESAIKVQVHRGLKRLAQRVRDES